MKLKIVKATVVGQVVVNVIGAISNDDCATLDTFVERSKHHYSVQMLVPRVTQDFRIISRLASLLLFKKIPNHA